MDDRELLERAAKADGIYEEPVHFTAYNSSISFGPSCVHWDPLNDDGEALRLMTDLFITVTPGLGRCTASWWGGPLGITQGEASILVQDGDVQAATRRAIVCAAAEIATQPTGRKDSAG